jgi:hypothetical protein
MNERRRALTMTCAALWALALWSGCDAVPPTSVPTEGFAGGHDGPEGSARAASTVAENQPPQMVVKVNPGPGPQNVIAGTSPFTFDLNLCRSVDPDEDPILFTMDSDGDGALDESGTKGGNCRRTFTYLAEPGQVRELTAVACVVDLDTAGKPRREAECRSYALRVTGAEPPRACAQTPPFGFYGYTPPYLMWPDVQDATSYNLYVKTVPNCDSLDSLTIATLADEKIADVRSPFDVSSFNVCRTCYYVVMTSVTGTCESAPGGGIGFMIRPCR